MTDEPDTPDADDTPFDFDNLEPGDVPVSRPLDDDSGDPVELKFYGFAEKSASPLMIQGTVERDGGDAMVTYDIVDLTEDEEKFIVEPDRIRNTRVEEAIRESGGILRREQEGYEADNAEESE